MPLAQDQPCQYGAYVCMCASICMYGYIYIYISRANGTKHTDKKKKFIFKGVITIYKDGSVFKFYVTNY